MKTRFWLITLLIALPAASGCLQYPEKVPNPDSLVDVPTDVPDEVTDTVDDTDDAVSDADTDAPEDVVRDVPPDAVDVSEVETDVEELCIDGDECDDGDPCTVNDLCDQLGACVGTLVESCDDQLACTVDSCLSPTECTHEVMEGFCLAGGVCYAADAMDIEHFGQCRKCQPDVASNDMSPDDTLTCNDATACTDGDHCSSGQCIGTALICNDLNPCTDDSCDAVEGCKTSPNTNQCGAARCDGMMFYGAATCSGGVCPTIVPENCDDGNPCTSDFCKTTGCSHTIKNGSLCKAGSCDMGTYYAPAYCISDVCPEQDSTFCDDGNICTADICSPDSGCNTLADNTKVCGVAGCNGKIFTPAVTCFNKNCPAAIPRTCDDGNVCTDDVCTLTGCQNNENNVPCSDGNPCTLDDACDDKACKSGLLKDCNDDLWCTQDVCDTGSGECTWDHTGTCLIDGKCYSDAEPNPDNTCQQCQAYVDPIQWRPAFSGVDCDQYAFGTAKCQNGDCDYACNMNRGDCDLDQDNGCETNLLNDPDYCGNCQTDCGTQVCSWGLCADNCAGDLELCNGRCEDTTTSLEHCGDCNTPCAYDNANVSCTIGICSLVSCKTGYYNVDLITDNGCECQSSGLEVCDGIDNDCNGATDDVLVEMLASDPGNCGQCGRVCNGGDKTVYGFCSGGNCIEVPCASNNWDIDKSPLNACEYFCVFSGSESCGNAVDEDCSGATDNGC